MTKVTILGEEKPKEGKKIEFKLTLQSTGKIEDGCMRAPSDFDNVVLISKKYTSDGLDLMFAYDNKRQHDCNPYNALYLGHFNDGIV